MISAATVITELQLFTYENVMQAHNKTQAVQCAQDVFDCLYQNFKTRQIYVPSPVNQQRKTQYQAIFEDFTGHNHHELAIRYGRSVPGIYKVIKTMMKQYVDERQPALFSNNEETDPRPIIMYVIEEYLPPAFMRHGLHKDFAISLAEQISHHACQRFPGILVTVPDSLGKAPVRPANNNQPPLF